MPSTAIRCSGSVNTISTKVYVDGCLHPVIAATVMAAVVTGLAATAYFAEQYDITPAHVTIRRHNSVSTHCLKTLTLRFPFNSVVGTDARSMLKSLSPKDAADYLRASAIRHHYRSPQSLTTVSASSLAILVSPMGMAIEYVHLTPGRRTKLRRYGMKAVARSCRRS